MDIDRNDDDDDDGGEVIGARYIAPSEEGHTLAYRSIVIEVCACVLKLNERPRSEIKIFRTLVEREIGRRRTRAMEWTRYVMCELSQQRLWPWCVVVC